MLSSADVERLLPMADCIQVMEEAFRAMARGEASFPPREAMPQPDRKGILGLMPGYYGPGKVMGLKATSVFPGNLGTQFESHQGAILVFETVNGRLLAVVDAGSVTRIRTAAVSALATRLLARKNCTSLAILGSGDQAASHLTSMRIALPAIDRVDVWSRDQGHAKRFAERHGGGGLKVVAVSSAKEAVEGADVICTVTGSPTPILEGAWLSPGTHVNAVGSSRPPNRELDNEAVAKSLFFVDSRQSALLESSDFLVPRSEGAVGEDHIRGELAELIEGKVPGRTNDDQVTVFKSLGLAVEDLAAANHVYSKANSGEYGTWVELGAERH